jgi:hypothetical protein
MAPSPTAHAAEVLHGRLRSAQLGQAAGAADSWLWHGYLATGKTTLLTSQWKCGKSTLIAILLGRMGKGGMLAGLPVSAARVAVVTEEGPGVWDERCRRLGIGGHVSFFCQPFKTKPTLEQWLGLLEAMRILKQQEGLDLVVIDTLATFLPGDNENTAGAMMRCLLPLDELKALGVGVLLVHHPRKGVSAPGQAARGSGALPGYVDILIEKSWVGRPDDADDRRRWLRAFSRFEQTRRRTVIELSAGGGDYADRGPLPDEKTSACAAVLRLVLEDTCDRLTQRQMLERWPEDFEKPDLGTLSRTLQRAVAEGWVRRQGTGRKNDPFRYWLPEREEMLYPGSAAGPEALARWQRHWQEKVMADLGLNESLSLPEQSLDLAPAAAVPAPLTSAAADGPVAEPMDQQVEREEPMAPAAPEPRSAPPSRRSSTRRPGRRRCRSGRRCRRPSWNCYGRRSATRKRWKHSGSGYASGPGDEPQFRESSRNGPPAVYGPMPAFARRSSTRCRCCPSRSEQAGGR